MTQLKRYRSFVFDCDGVLLDSNQVKSEAFRLLGAQYGDDVGETLLAHHKATGGVSRFVKVRWMHENLLDGPVDEDAVQADLARYGELVMRGLGECAVLPGVREFLDSLPTGVDRVVVSGGKRDEVVWALGKHGLRFDRILGSPTPKDAHFQALADDGILDDAVYFGDSRYDFVVATQFEVDFVFLHGVSEFAGWREAIQGDNVVGIEADMRALRLQPAGA